ncbi:MAG: CHAT domain-containing protein [Anaerolineae bacterium]|nr:CHAT domain-containing protein [Anaerolineae bacterium]
MVEQVKYRVFDLLISPSDGGYCAQVLDSPAGPTEEVVEPHLAQLLHTFSLPTQCGEAQTLGMQIFDAVFHDKVLAALQRSVDAVSRESEGLRIRLRLSDAAPELAALPWEFLYSPAWGRFLCQSIETPVVRYPHLAEPIPPFSVQLPLRILVIIPNPKNYPPLEVEREWAAINEALAELIAGGQVVVERLAPPTVLALQRHLRRSEVHVLHFMGHGEFDDALSEGRLVFEGAAGVAHPVDGQSLSTLLHNERSLRLAVLNACESGVTSRSALFAGTAQRLVQQGIPAVLAMQFEVADAVAIELVSEFYTALADGYPVDAALTEGRQRVFLSGEGVAWATPVLYMRALDGDLFGIQASSTHKKESDQPVSPIAPAQDWAELIRTAYQIIREYERNLQVSDRPEEKLRGRRQIEEKWAEIAQYLKEYLSSSKGKLPEDIGQIAVRFPELLLQYAKTAIADNRVDNRPDPPAVSAPNPFGVIGRITDPAHFFGHEDLLRQVFEELSKGVNVSLVGESQTGKSSILSMVCALGPERLNLPPERFAYLSLAVVDNEDEFYEALCDLLHVESCRGFKLTRALRGRRHILCLDEFEKMNWDGFTIKVRSQLRGLADGADAPLKLVIASRQPLARLFPDSPEQGSPLAGICRTLDVRPFSAAARTFLLNHLQGTSVTFTEDEIANLIAQTGGNPAKLQQAAAELYSVKRKA